ncbi:hypothetical protein JJQ72_05700 [Paenibacillus sp. F411]|uniref:hypothetical protein n=1 Tax=Paenibacillus sp. F411 TaxID=2820239 RepID=UPI001AAE92FC|nr:hypothetical protein [Paenibacillus sp. F411]MBO2943473.1 hypothetical protein [Paenibacillus sp. F411]
MTEREAVDVNGTNKKADAERKIKQLTSGFNESYNVSKHFNEIYSIGNDEDEV